jgi:transcriptional regulator with XRE-family HTH domain
MEKSAFTPLAVYFRQRLVAMRKAAGLSQRKLAVRLRRDYCMVERIEQGERRLDFIEFFWLCQACRADPEKVAVELIRAFKAMERTPSKSSVRRGRHKRLRSRRP